MRPVLTAEDLLAGASSTYSIAIPTSVLRPAPGEAAPSGVAGEVVLRPLQVRDVERVARAAKDQRVLASVLMVQQALVQPKLTVEQVGSLPAGLVQFLMDQVSALSGLNLGDDDLDKAVKAPLARACFVLAREFGWTPEECANLTLGQILVYLEMIGRGQAGEGATA